MPAPFLDPANGRPNAVAPNQSLQLPGRPLHGRCRVQVTMSGVLRIGVAGPQLSSTVRRPSRMNQRLRYAVVCLVAGFAINVSVTGWCLFRIDALDAPRQSATALVDDYVWMVDVWKKPGSVRVVSARWRDGLDTEHVSGDPSSILPGWTSFHRPQPSFDSEDPGAEGRFADGRGWPLVSFWGELEHHHTSWPSAAGSHRNVLPLRPAWAGLLTNTLLYAMIASLAVLFAHLPLFTRHRRRLLRGLCPACAYPRGQSKICTECGRPLPSGAGTLAA